MKKIIIIKNKGNNNIISNKNYKTNDDNNYIKYINEEFYPKARQKLNINPKNTKMVDIIGDGNCLYRSISRFIYGDEFLHLRERNEIYNNAFQRLPSYPDITLETENGPLHITKYKNNIKIVGFYGGKLEIGIDVSIYIINIATFQRNE